MPNLTNFYKRIFLHVIPVRIIVPCYYLKVVEIGIVYLAVQTHLKVPFLKQIARFYLFC